MRTAGWPRQLDPLSDGIQFGQGGVKQETRHFQALTHFSKMESIYIACSEQTAFSE